MVEIWPYGLAWGTRHRPQPAQGVVALSLCCPTSGFSTSQAMERNSLIYALSQVTFVIEPRFRQGGTWHGAVEALRKLRSVLLVAGEGQGATGLSHLGATVFDPLTFEEFSQGLRLPSIIPWALAQGSGGKPSQPSLFGNSLVRETRPLWPDAVPLPTHSAQSRLDSATL
ncbi:MAG: hypothetical protein MUC92_05505 [Fimbriimonadaceae bacterium]|nr:hypothetical protein [Fimbriimonadaceae bacterium]